MGTPSANAPTGRTLKNYMAYDGGGSVEESWKIVGLGETHFQELTVMDTLSEVQMELSCILMHFYKKSQLVKKVILWRKLATITRYTRQSVLLRN